MPAPNPLAVRIHNGLLQLVGTAMLKAEQAERLEQLGRYDEVGPVLLELRSSLDQTVYELRSIMTDLKRRAA